MAFSEKKLLRDSLEVRILLKESLPVSVNQVRRTTDLVHGDFHNQNILFNKKGRVTSILDFEHVHFGDGLFDVMHFIRLGCCNTGYKPPNLRLAQLFARKYLLLNPRLREDIKSSLQSYLLYYASSLFLEKTFLENRDPFYLSLIQRDINSFHFFMTHFDYFFESIFD